MRDERVTLVIPGKPGAKGRPRFNRASGRTFTPTKTVKYETMLRVLMAEAMGQRAPLDGPVLLDVTFILPEPTALAKKFRGLGLPHTKRPDLDNLLKSVLDAGNEILFVDDARVCKMIVEKKMGSEPRTIIVARPYDD